MREQIAAVSCFPAFYELLSRLTTCVERNELEQICSLYSCDRECNEQYGIVILSDYGIPIEESTFAALDWLNEHHFDYRGLIPMGLAIEAPEGMYNTKQ